MCLGLGWTGTGSLTANHVGPNTPYREGYKMVSAIQWFFTEVQCESFRRSCDLQKCESDVPCDHLMVEAYTSYRRSP